MELLIHFIPIFILIPFAAGMLFFLKRMGRGGARRDGAMQTAQEFLSISKVEDGLLLLEEGSALSFIRVSTPPIDLLSRAEQDHLIRLMTSELRSIHAPFTILAVSRPVDLTRMVDYMRESMRDAELIRKQLLREEVRFLNTLGDQEKAERQFYVQLVLEEGEVLTDFRKRTAQFAERLRASGASVSVLRDKEIVRLLRLISSPSTARLENGEYQRTIPFLDREEQ